MELLNKGIFIILVPVYSRGQENRLKILFLIVPMLLCPNLLALEQKEQQLVGFLEPAELSKDGLIIRGWACSIESSEAPRVTLYFQNLRGTEVKAGEVRANQNTRAIIKKKCPKAKAGGEFVADLSPILKESHSGQILVYSELGTMIRKLGLIEIPNGATTSEIRYHIDSIKYEGDILVLRGWACTVSEGQPVAILIYRIDQDGVERLVTSELADGASESAVGLVCNDPSAAGHRFVIRVPSSPEEQEASTFTVYANQGALRKSLFNFALPKFLHPVKLYGGYDGVLTKNERREARGWACVRGDSDSLKVLAYVRNADGSETLAIEGRADQPSEIAVSQICQSGSARHRFAIDIRAPSPPAPAASTDPAP